jgi:CzcA family heavy metal efflux pump
MLAILIRNSIRYYGIVIVLAALVLLVGAYRFATADLDIFPEFSPKQVIIQTEAPGLSSEQVELSVTQQIELAIKGAIGLQTVRSESIQGLSIVTAIFDDNSDIYHNRQLIDERLPHVTGRLPKDISPLFVPLSSSSATVLTLGLRSEHVDLMALRTLVDWTLVPRLHAVEGVADVNVFGGAVKQLQIQVDPRNLKLLNLSLEEVIQAATQAANTQGSGFVETLNQRFTVQVTGLPTTPEQFANTIVKRYNGLNITLGEVATITYAPTPAIGAAQIMGKPGIVAMVIAQYGANTLTVSKALEKMLAEITPSLSKQGIQFYPHLFRPADYIEQSISNLSRHLLVGGLFVLLILYLFLFNVRTAIISALAIPVSLLGAVLVLLAAGVNLNIMVLGGLAIALGEVVDDAIIDTENIFRRLRENRLLPQPLPVDDVINAASLEVRSSVVYANFIVALVFVPLLTLDGVAGRLFAPLGYSYILAILLSLLVALTLTPALCRALLGGLQSELKDPPLSNRLKNGYNNWLLFANRHFKPLLIISLGVCLLSFAAFSTIHYKYLPELREGHYIVHTASIPGTSLAESIRIGTQLTQQFMAIQGVESVSQWAGRAERGADTTGSHYSEYEIRLKPNSGAGQQAILDKIRNILANFPGISFEANSFLIERVDETISGYTAPVAVNIFDNNFDTLDVTTQAVVNLIKDIPGASNVQVRSPPGTPFVQVHLKLNQLAYWGVTPEQVMACLQTAYKTKVVGKSFEGNKIFDIAVTLLPEQKWNIMSIGDLPIKTLDDMPIKLAQVADIRPNTGRYNILRQNFKRKQTITANIVGRDMNDFMDTLKARVAKEIHVTADSYLEFTGAAVEQATVRSKLILHSLLAGAGVLILIYIAIGNLRLVLLTLVNLPFALIGGIAAALLTGGSLSVGSVVGFITLFGITVRNCIMLLSHCQYLVEHEGKTWNMDTITKAAQERLPSILMTALVTALAMSPIAFNSDNPGSEIMGPMAAIIIGGLFSSTLLNLLMLPCLLIRYGKH